MENIVQTANSNRGQVDTWTKLQLQQLVQAKLKGEINNEQIADALLQISEGAQFDETKLTKDPSEGQHSIHELIADRDRFS